MTERSFSDARLEALTILVRLLLSRLKSKDFNAICIAAFVQAVETLDDQVYMQVRDVCQFNE